MRGVAPIRPDTVRVVVCDKLERNGVLRCEYLLDAEKRQSRSLRNFAEKSHRSTRRRERQTQRIKVEPRALRFLPARAFIYGRFGCDATSRTRVTTASRATTVRVWIEDLHANGRVTASRPSISAIVDRDLSRRQCARVDLPNSAVHKRRQRHDHRGCRHGPS
jgi:hypothetical protein